LQDVRTEKSVALKDFKENKALVVVFLGTECPINNLYLPVLADLHKNYKEKGIAFLGINSNAHENVKAVAEHARSQKVPFPVLKDPANKVADSFQAKRTPEVFVLDKTGAVLYRGRIDDQFGIGYKRPGKPTRRDLAEALDELLAGKPVSLAKTDAVGCLIGRQRKARPSGRVTYTKEISRILQNRCQECHRPGQIGPMSLQTYNDAVAWAEPIREAVTDNRMPPWHADPKHGKWSNDRRLSKEERATLLAWLNEGTPRGNEKDLPAPKKWPKGWVIGNPDVILKMPKPFHVPAKTPKGGVPYQYISVPTNFTEDRWIERAEAKAGAPAVVHHILVFIIPKGEIFRPDGPGNVLAGHAPGDMPMILKPGQAKKLPAGARLLFQMHYTPNGREYDDQSMIGLIFAKKPPKHRVFTKPVHNSWFMSRWIRIPAGAANFKIEANHTFTENVRVIHFMPHMHLRGKSFIYEAIHPGGKRETLLSVPHYNFNWQSIYRAAQPQLLAKGTRLHCVAHFDNSAKNPNNPDPSKAVTWGDQTWEEMMVGWIDYILEEGKPKKAS
jgi:peroxiredoxin